jgi:RimJ/RimL family protein N-acetyltransferase
MRAAVLYFGFVGLGAERALSGAFDDNRASLGVSRALGYRENGDDVVLRRQSPGRIIHLALTRADWEANRWPDPIAIDGLEACLPLFGLGDEGRGL